MVIIDTTVWIDYLRGVRNPETDWLEREADKQRLGLTDLILCEVLQGVRSDGEFNKVLTQLLNFELFETGGEHLAIAAAQNFRSLRKKGRTVRKTIDCLIATFCILNGHSLLHRDGDFQHFEELLGLSVVQAE
jgi:predicted nucleic acid-binding protein